MEFDYLQIREMPSYNDPVHYNKIECLMEKEWNEINNFKYRSYTEINAWQLERIRELVIYAYNNIPLYRRKYDEAGIDIAKFCSWKDFESLPIIYKEEIIKGFPDEIVANRSSYTHTVRSSGTQGQFVTIGVSDEAFYRDTILGIRQFKYQNTSVFTEQDCVLFIYGSPWAVSSINGKYRHDFVSMYGNIEECVRAIQSKHPTVIRAYPSLLKRLTEVVGRLDIYGVTSIICCSEPSDRRFRNMLEKHFSVTVLDEYASEELTRIALECPYKNYHLEEDSCYAEIVDIESKKTVPYGTQGLLVGTNLLNEATPLIRYCQGDIACIIGEDSECNCGSHFRKMMPPAGRLLDSILTKDGRIIPGSYLIEVAYNWLYYQDIPLHGWQYQIIQEENYSVHVYIVPYKSSVSNKMKQDIIDSFDSLFKDGTKVILHIVDKLPYVHGKKNRVVMSRVKRN